MSARQRMPANVLRLTAVYACPFMHLSLNTQNGREFAVRGSRQHTGASRSSVRLISNFLCKDMSRVLMNSFVRQILGLSRLNNCCRLELYIQLSAKVNTK